MSYQISEQLISYNRSHQTLNPQGFVIHDTDDVGATSQNEHDYFNSGNRQASAHYFTDWTSIIRTIPENEVAWHAGSIANNKFLSVEMCCPSNHNVSQFQEVWNRTVWLVADSCVRYGWTSNEVWSHKGISDTYHQTDHQDPYAFIQSYGKTWSDLLNAIDAKIVELKNNTPTSTIQSQPIQQGDDFYMEHAVFYFTERDFSLARMISSKLHDCAMYCRNGVNTNIHPDIKSVKHPIFVGGAEYHDNPNTTNCCGNHDYDTAELASQYAKTL
jgi:N-acetylmuramoyl-L-alanine amidase CwlA